MPPAGQAYELWALAGAQPVPAGVFSVTVAAGTYDVGVRYKVSVEGTVSAKERKLWVVTLG